MRLWKWIGVAGVAGVAATGVVVARNERHRQTYTPDDVRARLHARAVEIGQGDELPAIETTEKSRLTKLLERLRR